jgi:transposase-like protein
LDFVGKAVLKVDADVLICSSSPLSVPYGERRGGYEVRGQSCEQAAVHILTPKKKMASERVNKRKSVVLTIATKLQIVERADNGEWISKLAAELNIGNQTVRDTMKKKDEFHKFVTLSDTFNGTANCKSTKHSKSKDLDTAVFNWFKQK